MPDTMSAEEIVRGLRIEAIKARCEAATPGPWHHEKDCLDYIRDGGGSNICMVYQREDDAFIAHAREDIPYLLERIVELEGQLAGAGANSLIQSHIIKSQHHPLDTDKIVRLTMENVTLRAQLTASQQETSAAVEERDTLMRRYHEQVEIIRRRIDAGGLTEEEARLLDDLMLPRQYDRRGPQEAGEGER